MSSAATARYVLTGRFRVPLPPDDAFHLFTARGEQQWVEGWSPRFPAGDDTADTTPGAVFQTGPDHSTTTWVVIDAQPPRTISYARVLPGDTAGTVSVSLDDDDGRSSVVEVVYDLTALSAPATVALADFADGYDAYLRSWQDDIEMHLSRTRPRPGATGG